MTGLDTNILVRFFAQDDPVQSRKADRLLQSLTAEAPGYVSLVSLVELVWVMRSIFHVSKHDLVESLERLLDSPEIVLENQTAVDQALRRFAAVNVDFADCLIERSGFLAGCRSTVTFDAQAARATGMTLLKR
jgi:predicted nucleic-acid-binding protein